ncbi:Hypothetical protein R9X50_00213400 [Acrodontium crateriforme]|uniref:Myb-like domain-containing protein n=1 Tax=Acrodontium crateriforme TaxID=150365 RepID=A0AAQ3M096_9PEZI|nr:Hypothetical protein R9X50_00213400 [Acrodontium crateriforme]
MAKAQGTASRSGRQNATADAAGTTTTTRSTRVTRAQSIDPEPRPNEPAATKRRVGRRGAKDVDTELATVDENAVDERQLQAQARAAEMASAQFDIDDATRRISAHTDMSGTTAKTSFSQEEIAELDRDVILDSLPRLSISADELAKYLLPQGEQTSAVKWKEIRTPRSKESKLFNTRLTNFTLNKQDFGSQEYIHSEYVLRALLGAQSMAEIPPAPWRPDNIISKINLAIMLRGMLITCEPGQLSEEGYLALENLESRFPVAIAGLDFNPKSLEICVEIQTQLAIARLAASASSPQFDPSNLIEETFLVTNIDLSQNYKYFDELHLNAADAAYEGYILKRVAQLKDPFAKEKKSFSSARAAINGLRALFPWHVFIDRIVSFYVQRKAALDASIRAAGEVENIVKGLQDEIQTRALEREASAKLQDFIDAESTPGKAFGRGAIARLKSRQSQVGSQPAAPVAPMATDSGDNNDWMPAGDDQNNVQMAQNTLAAMNRFNSFRDNLAAKTKGKQKSMYDLQAGAQRVLFDESQQQVTEAYAPQASTTGPYHINPRSVAGKRTHDEIEDFDPTQDEGFENDTRGTAAADERRRKVPRSSLPNPARASMHQFQSGANFVFPSSSSADNTRKNPGSSIPDPVTGLTTQFPKSQFFTQAKTLARQASVMATQSRPPQVRTPWSADEENGLIELIEEHCSQGISYAALKKIDQESGDPKLPYRNAEDMRFKARNMKVTMLLARTGLPTNWEAVILDKKGKEKLANRGIEYHQAPVRVTSRNVE